MIWSLASRKVAARRSFCPVRLASAASLWVSLSSSSRDVRGESASLPRKAAYLLLKEGDLVRQDLDPDLVIMAGGASAVVTRGHAPHPLLKSGPYLDPTYAGHSVTSRRPSVYCFLLMRSHLATASLLIRDRLSSEQAALAASSLVRVPALNWSHLSSIPLNPLYLISPGPASGSTLSALSRPAPPGWRQHAGCEPASRDQKAGVTHHPVIRAYRESLDMPAAKHAFP